MVRAQNQYSFKNDSLPKPIYGCTHIGNSLHEKDRQAYYNIPQYTTTAS